MKKHLLLFVALLFVAGTVLGFAGTKKAKIAYEAPLDESKPVTGGVLHTSVPPAPNVVSLVGTSTSLTGFYDYQSNGGSIDQIRVNPANGNIHVTFMLADDSTAAGLNAARRVGYAFSSNGGSTWNNFSNSRVPSRRAGFPSIDLLQGANAGSPAIANHSTITGTNSTIFVDSPEGTGAFSEITAPPLIDAGGADEPIWPHIAGTPDGSVVMPAARNTGATDHYTRTTDFTGWSAWTQITGPASSIGRSAQANGTGRVGILVNTCNPPSLTTGGNWWTESTNNGQTWSTPTNIYGFRSSGVDTFLSYVHSDFVYNGNNPLFVFSETHNTLDADQIAFWSQATGFTVAVKSDTNNFKFDPVNQRFHALRLGWPSIGLSGSNHCCCLPGIPI